jgi:hypothetical protein
MKSGAYNIGEIKPSVATWNLQVVFIFLIIMSEYNRVIFFMQSV